MAQPVSVCHQWSTTGMPSRLRRPVVGAGVEPFAGLEQILQRRQVVLAEVSAVGVLLLDRPDRGRRGEQRLHPVFGRHPPERARVRRADRLALVEHGRRAEHQRAVDDVGVADHPADVGGGPVHVARLGVVDVAHAPQQRDGVPAVVADDSLGSARRARRVEHVQRVGGRDGHRIDRLRRRPSARASRGRVRPAGSHGRWSRCTMTQAGGACSAMCEGGVDHRLVVDGAGRLDAAGRGDDGGGPGVVDAGGQFAARRTRRTPPSGPRPAARTPASR